MPRIYVASLSDYNAGTLHGVWIDLDGKDAVDLGLEIAEMLRNSPASKLSIAEEFAIHDHDGFGGINLGEYADITTVVKLAELLEEHGEAFAAWYDNEDRTSTDLDDLSEEFSDAYAGEFENLADYAQETALGTGSIIESAFSTWPTSCIDWDQAGNELELAGDIWTATSPTHGIYVFNGNV